MQHSTTFFGGKIEKYGDAAIHIITQWQIAPKGFRIGESNPGLLGESERS